MGFICDTESWFGAFSQDFQKKKKQTKEKNKLQPSLPSYLGQQGCGHGPREDQKAMGWFYMNSKKTKNRPAQIICQKIHDLRRKRATQGEWNDVSVLARVYRNWRKPGRGRRFRQRLRSLEENLESSRTKSGCNYPENRASVLHERLAVSQGSCDPFLHSFSTPQHLHSGFIPDATDKMTTWTRHRNTFPMFFLPKINFPLIVSKQDLRGLAVQ